MKIAVIISSYRVVSKYILEVIAEFITYILILITLGTEFLLQVIQIDMNNITRKNK